MVVFDQKSMIAAEKAAMDAGVSQKTLMDNAGKAAALFICEQERLKNKKVAVVCGKGNNGGDGFVVAQRLFKAGAKVSVVLASAEEPCGVALSEFNLISKRVKKVYAKRDISLAEKVITDSDIIVDAIFGLGFKGSAKETQKKLIEIINSAKGLVYSIDIPSGLESDSGLVEGAAVRADNTLTFEALKPCHILPPANSYCGKVTMLKIGISEEIINEIRPVCKVIEAPCLPKRDKNAHKGSCGTVLSVCGCYGMPGAAILAAKAALRSGVGKLFAVCPHENYTIMAVSVPEAVLLPLSFEDDLKTLLEKLPLADALLIGCGIGVSNKKQQAVRELVCAAKTPVIIDADGINCIYHDIDFIKKVKADVVLTPHAGEMAKLTGKSIAQVEENRAEIASQFAKENGVYLCLKGANTLVATPEGELFVNLTGTPGLATAGSGDVLSGIISALIASGLDTLTAVTSAVYIHGKAGEKAAEELGEKGMIAGDIIEKVPYLL